MKVIITVKTKTKTTMNTGTMLKEKSGRRRCGEEVHGVDEDEERAMSASYEKYDEETTIVPAPPPKAQAPPPPPKKPTGPIQRKEP